MLEGSYSENKKYTDASKTENSKVGRLAIWYKNSNQIQFFSVSKTGYRALRG